MSLGSKVPGAGLGVVFIHSLFRSGSTYLFQAFRRAVEGYCCYQEPLHELTLSAGKDRDVLLVDQGQEKNNLLRHPKLDRPYFAELSLLSDHCLSLLNKRDIYDAYFAMDGRSFGIDFWMGIISETSGRPVIQECRTSSRIGVIKRDISGFHIYLWRNPWDQWWSYKVANYFDVASQLIINSENHPEVIGRLRREIGFESFASDDIVSQFEWFEKRPFLPEQSFLVFYVLWFLGLQEGIAQADLVLNIDRLSDSLEYRREIICALEFHGISGLDFSDCIVPQAVYGEEDRKFFRGIEDKAHGLLLLSGVPQRSIDEVIALRQANEPLVWRDDVATAASTPQLIRDAERARALARRFNSQEIKQRIKSEEQLAAQRELYKVAEARAVSAESQANQAEARVVAAESQAKQAEARVVAAESQAKQAEARVVSAESQAKQAEARAVAAKAQADQAEARSCASEAYVSQLKDQLEQSQLQINKALESAHGWWVKAGEYESELQKGSQKLSESLANSHQWWLQAGAHEARVQALLSSTSWRITAPLRMSMVGLKKLVHLPGRLIKNMLQSVVKLAMRVVLKRSVLRQRLTNRLRCYPWLFQRLRQFALHRGLLAGGVPVFSADEPPVVFYTSSQAGVLPESLHKSEQKVDLRTLTPRAREIYWTLKKVMQDKGKN